MEDSMTSRSLHAAAVQFQPGPHPEANLSVIAEHCERVAEQGVTLVVFPEYSQVHFPEPGPAWTAHRETLDGAFVGRLVDIARHTNLTIVAGMVETGREENPHNTQVAVTRDGLVAANRKIHLYDAFSMRESDLFAASDPVEPQLWESQGFTIGVQTCYDLRFPEVTRRLVDRGADIVLVPAQWVPGPHKTHQWLTLLQARAIENQVWLIAADHPQPTGVGASVIVSPRGEVVAQAGENLDTISHLISGEILDEVRRENPMATARRFRVDWR
jgi:deaminated glutathione amidase